MCKTLPRRCLLISLAVIAFIPPQIVQAQLASSAFTEASVAYIGLTGLGVDFVSANPAILSDLSHNHRFACTLEATHNNLQTSFKDKLPDFVLQLAITPRLTIALAQSERAPGSEAQANRNSRDDPFFRHPLHFLVFAYQQDWSAGIGLQLKSNLRAGVAMRHENYLVVPANLGPFSLGQSIQAFDFGIRRSSKKFNLGLVFRNLFRNRTTKPFSQPLKFVNLNDPSQSFAWYPMQFNGVAFAPKFALEGGVHWVASSHWHLLGDVSSRKEYALGLRWRVFSRLFITTGTGKRFDRIYSDEAATYTSLGGQFQKEKFALGLTWIISTRSGRNQIVSMPYGMFNLRQITNNRLLIAGALSL